MKQLTYFVALAETRSFGAAAARVNISQPALSLQIKELETGLGVTLAERLPREIRLTRAGQTLLDRAQKLLSDMRDLEHAVRMQQGLAGRLTLGVIPSIAPYLLPLALTRLRAHDITLDIRVREAQTAQLIDGLLDGQLDAAVISLPVTQPGLVAEPLFEDRFVLAGSSARLETLETAHRLGPSHVPPDQLLLLDEGHCLADQALEACGFATLSKRVDLGASSLSTLCGLVAEGFGLTFLPEIALRTEAGAFKGLELRRFAAPEPARMVALARRSTSEDDGWAGDLAALLGDAGRELVSYARGAGRA
ncbi:MAG: LysR substrate-binding domain-containing protein [Rhodobacter sp.]|nr:LysR substrate-binding domain-containing protein [Rhodobacter sp.]